MSKDNKFINADPLEYKGYPLGFAGLLIIIVGFVLLKFGVSTPARFLIYLGFVLVFLGVCRHYWEFIRNWAEKKDAE